MKKFLLLVAFVMFSIGAFAAGPSCTVPNSNGKVVVLSKSSATTDESGRIFVGAYVSQNAKVGDGFIQVLVNIYDAMTDKKVDAVSFTIPSSGQESGVYSHNVQKGKAYYFEIHRATCE